MATRRTTHDKRQRERAKQEKAAAKRARRQDRDGDPDVEIADTVDTDESTEQLLAKIEALHARYDEGSVSFEDFEEEKSSLLDRIAVRLSQ